jgi:hypothetical protein
MEERMTGKKPEMKERKNERKEKERKLTNE